VTACRRLQKKVKLYFSIGLPSSQRCTKKRCRSREPSMNTWLQYWTVGSIASKSPGDLQKLLHHESRITNLASGSFWLLRKQTFSPGGYELVYDSPQARLDRERLRLDFSLLAAAARLGRLTAGPFLRLTGVNACFGGLRIDMSCRNEWSVFLVRLQAHANPIHVKNLVTISAY